MINALRGMKDILDE
ncbi:MAG: hypothetical protein QG567_1476, partial [Campylobacterota bacterium]|nr:hypothetical protein [Campylobacterota bacterium]